jgi:hypothetical protein
MQSRVIKRVKADIWTSQESRIAKSIKRCYVTGSLEK